MQEKDIDFLNNWFLKNENCTYKDFCDIYNNGDPIKDNLSFIKFPDKILKIIKNGNISLSKFLQKEGAYYSFLKNRIAIGSSDEIYEKRLKGTVKREIDYAFDWISSPEGHEFWNNLHKKWERT